ncbi:MAG: hypothetical protein CL896_00460 [Dehalococcoidia bacterium]|nr:hypothetical protein [Dehalococcoidia bacterium]|tara:strand:- start:1341 stop:2651 length:1311 start_codon:yes stop_codon:yes gene_type:complete
MSKEEDNNKTSGYSFGTREIRLFLTAPVQRWKVTLTSFCVVIGIGILLVVFASPAPIYESKAQILITQPVDPNEGGPPSNANSQQIFPGMFIPNSMTLSTLASLALSNDLFDGIIQDLALTDSVTGEPFSLERLAAMTSAVIQYDYDEGNNLPLLDLSVRGNNPKQIQDITNTWADAFIKENKDLFSSEAARSYDKWLELLTAKEQELEQEQETALAYVRENSENLLQEQLDILAQDLKNVSARLLVLKEEASRADARKTVLSDELEKLDELLAVYSKESYSEEQVLDQGSINDVWARIKQEIILQTANLMAYRVAEEQAEIILNEITQRLADKSTKLASVTIETDRFNEKISRLREDLPYIQSLLTESTIAKEGQTMHLRIVGEPATPGDPISGSISVVRATLVILLLAVVVSFMVSGLAQVIFPRNGSGQSKTA